MSHSRWAKPRKCSQLGWLHPPGQRGIGRIQVGEVAQSVGPQSPLSLSRRTIRRSGTGNVLANGGGGRLASPCRGSPAATRMFLRGRRLRHGFFACGAHPRTDGPGGAQGQLQQGGPFPHVPGTGAPPERGAPSPEPRMPLDSNVMNHPG